MSINDSIFYPSMWLPFDGHRLINNTWILQGVSNYNYFNLFITCIYTYIHNDIKYMYIKGLII